jgi:hypothetical protein
MASAQVQTTSTKAPFADSGVALALAGSRLWAAVQGGGSGSDTGLNLFYSDNDGATWTKPTGGDLDTDGGQKPSLCTYQISSVWKLAVVWAGGNSSSNYLKYAEITSNVNSATPGSITTSTIDSGGTNLGCSWPSLFVTATASNPRIWVVFEKWTTATSIETRAAYAAAPAGAGAWSTTNFTNLASLNTTSQGHYGTGWWWTISAADRATICMEDQAGQQFRAFTFDPTAASPTPGSATNFAALTGGFQGGQESDGPAFCAVAKADYAIFGRYDDTAGTWSFYKSVNGTTWTTPSGWTGLTMGRAALAYDGSSDFYLVHGTSYGDIATTASAGLYRKITASGDGMGGTASFSDTNFNPVTVPQNTGTSKLYAVYRAGTAANYSVRADFASIGGGGSPPAPPSVAPAVTGTTTVGQTLSTTDGTWAGGPTITYQWQRDGHGDGVAANIGSATANTYVSVDADNVCKVRCAVTATNASGSTVAYSNWTNPIEEPQPVNTVAPTLSGSTAPGGTLICSTGTWTGMGGYLPLYTYQWQVAGVNVIGETTNAYTSHQADLLAYARCVVTGHNQ